MFNCSLSPWLAGVKTFFGKSQPTPRVQKKLYGFRPKLCLEMYCSRSARVLYSDTNLLHVE